MNINELLSGAKQQFSLEIFSPKSIASVEAAFTEKNGKRYVKCLVRGKDIIGQAVL